MRLIKHFLPAFLIMLSACGGDQAPNSDSVAKVFNDEVIEGAGGDLSAAHCGQGGSSCPDGLECASYSGGREMCVLIAKPAVVLLKDATLGGSCLMHTDKDGFPGVSMGSVRLLAMDRVTVVGHGRLIWDKAGYEVASNRGEPPGGTEFTGDICTDAYNLGCDGQAIFEIVDEQGKVQNLREGQSLIVQTRGKKNCGEEFADGIEAAVCSDPVAAASGDLSSCSWDISMSPLNEDQYGIDRFGGTILIFTPQ
jgi:hypothetical protein